MKNSSFFKNINTEEQAYLLGFYVADGCINQCSKKSKRFKIAINTSDIEILQYFQKFMNPNKLITHSIQKNTFGKYIYECESSIFSFVDNEICNDLIEMGYGFRKTQLQFGLPNINNDLIHHFIRGYFDGDGCISVNENIRKSGKRKGDKYVGRFVTFTSLKDNILKEIKDVCLNHNIDFKLKSHKVKYNQLYIGSNLNIKNFYSYIYKDATIFLKRKKEKFEKLFTETSSAKNFKKIL